VPFSDKGVLIIDLNGQIAFANTYFCDFVGVEHSNIKGMSCFDFVFPNDLEAAKKLFEINKGPNAKPFRFMLKRGDGTPIWADIQGVAMRTASGEVYAVSATVTKSQERMSI
jgi:PAS domain S-box-containing protein